MFLIRWREEISIEGFMFLTLLLHENCADLSLMVRDQMRACQWVWCDIDSTPQLSVPGPCQHGAGFWLRLPDINNPACFLSPSQLTDDEEDQEDLRFMLPSVWSQTHLLHILISFHPCLVSSYFLFSSLLLLPYNSF